MVNIINKSELIAKDIEFKISTHKYKKNIPSERKLANKYSVSRNTIREALDILQNKNIISLVNNNYKINQPKKDYDWYEIFGKKTNNKIQNYLIKNTVLEANKKISQKLEVPLATLIRLLEYKRTIIENNLTKALSIDYIYVPESFTHQLTLEKLKDFSFWQLLSKKKAGSLLKEYQNLSIDTVNFEEASLLDIPVITKILLLTSKISVDDIKIYFISKKIPETSLIMQVDNHFKLDKD